MNNKQTNIILMISILCFGSVALSEEQDNTCNSSLKTTTVAFETSLLASAIDNGDGKLITKAINNKQTGFITPYQGTRFLYAKGIIAQGPGTRYTTSALILLSNLSKVYDYNKKAAPAYAGTITSLIKDFVDPEYPLNVQFEYKNGLTSQHTLEFVESLIFLTNHGFGETSSVVTITADVFKLLFLDKKVGIQTILKKHLEDIGKGDDFIDRDRLKAKLKQLIEEIDNIKQSLKLPLLN